MSVQEFSYWQAFNLLEPIGIEREDILFANIAKTIVDVEMPSHGIDFDDFMMFRQVQERTVDDLCDDIKSRMSSFM